MDEAETSRWDFRGIDIAAPVPADWDVFLRMIAEELPARGANALVLRVQYRYPFQSHPGVADDDPLTPGQCEEIAVACRAAGIRIIPKMNVFGHQSWKTGPGDGLLKAHPELDETPDKESVEYCRSLCPRHPDSAPIVCDLIDEVLDAFKADAIHVGLDEVFEIGHCPRCKGTPTSELFSEWVNKLHAHVVDGRGVEMFMWGDRLLDAGTTGYGKWEAAENGTAPAIDDIPKDIIICDWHYEMLDGYPSIEIFTGRGFRTIVCPWKKIEPCEALLKAAASCTSEKLAGILATTWCDGGAVAKYLVEGKGDPADEKDTPAMAGECFRRAMKG